MNAIKKRLLSISRLIKFLLPRFLFRNKFKPVHSEKSYVVKLLPIGIEDSYIMIKEWNYRFEIQISLENFNSFMETYLDPSFDPDDKEINFHKEVNKMLKNQKTIDVDSLKSEKSQWFLTDKIIGNLIEKELVSIFNKETQTYCDRVNIRKIRDVPHPLSGCGGREFKTEDGFDLSVTDWIS